MVDGQRDGDHSGEEVLDQCHAEHVGVLDELHLITQEYALVDAVPHGVANVVEVLHGLVHQGELYRQRDWLHKRVPNQALHAVVAAEPPELRVAGRPRNLHFGGELEARLELRGAVALVDEVDACVTVAVVVTVVVAVVQQWKQWRWQQWWC